MVTTAVKGPNSPVSPEDAPGPSGAGLLLPRVPGCSLLLIILPGHEIIICVFFCVYGFACYVPVCVCVNVGVSQEVRLPPPPRGDVQVLQAHLLERLTSLPPSLCLFVRSQVWTQLPGSFMT